MTALANSCSKGRWATASNTFGPLLRALSGPATSTKVCLATTAGEVWVNDARSDRQALFGSAATSKQVGSTPRTGANRGEVSTTATPSTPMVRLSGPATTAHGQSSESKTGSFMPGNTQSAGLGHLRFGPTGCGPQVDTPQRSAG